MTGVQHTATVWNVHNIMFVNRIKKMSYIVCHITEVCQISSINIESLSSKGNIYVQSILVDEVHMYFSPLQSGWLGLFQLLLCFLLLHCC